ncbi:putative DNA modification/repair radical SAM protein [Longimicrobium sp.]|jgi:putative DNA modification/repair radical SAM protein|uniref:putative DNA modification/repair radical SAM protein n=1 Tax=Longimicrobium sp. TaxID=2029185 RepID=UPI002ED7E22C
MEVADKLAILADAAKYDASCSSSGAKGRKGGTKGLGSTEGTGICHSYTPDGRCVSLLKILLTNVCIYDCQYCINRSSSSVRRARFTVQEVVDLTLDFYRRNYIEGLFLSSGIIRTPDYTMEQLVLVAKTLRREHGFAGYIHLKTIPDASPELLDEAGRWADRLSINVELPTQENLDRLAPEKKLVQITGAMSHLRDRIDQAKGDAGPRRSLPVFAPAGQSTQMIVGATDATDAAILSTASALYEGPKLRRVYYSGFSPIPDAASALPVVPTPLIREHRLYQADWLMRFYGFGADELTTREAPNLDLSMDPKVSWALRNRERFPVDVNRAPREDLLRIPGLGARNVKRILASRRWMSIRIDDLRRLGIPLRRSLPFIITADHRPTLLGPDSLDLRDRIAPKAAQVDLFESAVAATHGEL